MIYKRITPTKLISHWKTQPPLYALPKTALTTKLTPMGHHFLHSESQWETAHTHFTQGLPCERRHTRWHAFHLDQCVDYLSNCLYCCPQLYNGFHYSLLRPWQRHVRSDLRSL